MPRSSRHRRPFTPADSTPGPDIADLFIVAHGEDYIVDLNGMARRAEPDTRRTLRGRPWISVHWRCCEVYSRIYRNRQGTAYVGYCPRCARPVRVKVGPHGTSTRMFEAI